MMPAQGKIDQTSISSLLNPSDEHQKRTRATGEYLAVRDSLPKSGLAKVILRLNVCIQRRLEIEKAKIHRREKRYNLTFDQTRRAFLDQQAKKTRVWKSQDEAQMNGMKLPILLPESGRKSTMQRLYTNPRYPRADDAKTLSLMPYETLIRSRTEIHQHEHDIYTTKLPSVIDVNEYQLKRFKTFCAQDFIDNATSDSRFRILDGMLQRKKSGSPRRFTQWLAKRFPNGPSIKDMDNTNTEMAQRINKGITRGRTNLIFPSLAKKNREEPTQLEEQAVPNVTERRLKQRERTGNGDMKSRGSQRTYLTEEFIDEEIEEDSDDSSSYDPS